MPMASKWLQRNQKLRTKLQPGSSPPNHREAEEHEGNEAEMDQER